MNVLISKQVFIVSGGIYCINQHKQMQLVVYSVCACVCVYVLYVYACVQVSVCVTSVYFH